MGQVAILKVNVWGESYRGESRASANIELRTFSLDYPLDLRQTKYDLTHNKFILNQLVTMVSGTHQVYGVSLDTGLPNHILRLSRLSNHFFLIENKFILVNLFTSSIDMV